MPPKWNVVNVSKDDMDNYTLTTKVENALNQLSIDGWNVHSILDNYSINPGDRKFVALVCWKEEEDIKKK